MNLEDFTVYRIIYSAVDEKTENACKWLKKLVGAKGFEPSTSWSRTRSRILLKFVEFDGSEAIDNEDVGSSLLNAVEVR